MSWLIIGGDLRSLMLARIASGARNTVYSIGLPEVPGVESLTSAPPEAADVIVLPMPVAEQDGMIPAPLVNGSLPVEQAADLLRGRVWGGTAGPALTSILARGGVQLTNPNDLELYAVPNAALSAEGAVVSALSRYPGSAYGARVLIVGYGRIARVLARLIHSWGADAMVCARDPVQRAWAQADGHQAADISALAEMAAACDILFQTAPAMLVNKDVISGMNPGTFISDLTRGGVDIEAAEARGLAAWRDSGIPGRYAPEASARLLYDVITRGDP